MIEWEKRVLLKHYLDQGLSRSAAADKLGIHRRTIARWIAAGMLDRDVNEVPRYGPRPAVPSKLDPFKAIIHERLERYPKLTAERLFEEVQGVGYTGSYSTVRNYVRRVRPRPEPEPLIRFETEPGEQAQVDFAEFRLPWGKRFALLVVLGYSRLLWVRFFPRQTMQTLFTGLEQSFEFLGGVPEHLLFDQLKAVVVDDERLSGGELIGNAEFLRFSAHWGFRIRACRPYRAKTKGKVERPVSYLRSSFFYGREFLNDADLDEQLQRWLSRRANVRIHFTTKERPQERFERDERAALGPVAPRPYTPLVLPLDRRRRRSEAPRPRIPAIDVERRPLARYSAIAGGVA